MKDLQSRQYLIALLSSYFFGLHNSQGHIKDLNTNGMHDFILVSEKNVVVIDVKNSQNNFSVEQISNGWSVQGVPGNFFIDFKKEKDGILSVFDYENTLLFEVKKENQKIGLFDVFKNVHNQLVIN